MRGPKTPPLEIIPVPADAPLTFDLMAQAYLEDYVLQRYRTLSTARPRVEHLREFFGGWPAETITADAVRRYQLHRREQGAEAATTNRETSALSRMFQIAIRRGLLERMPLFSNRLEEDPLRDGFSEREETGQGVHEEIDSLYTAKSACYGGRTLQMTTMPLEVALELTPRARFDVINVRERAAAAFPGALDPFPRCLYYSFHTTAGYLEQGLASRLTKQCAGVAPYVDVFRQLFPEGAAYAHDRLERRPELTRTQRAVEPRNADSHLAFIAGGLRTCVSYRNRPADPVCFVDLDGVHQSQTRRRLTTIIGYTREEDVARLSIPVLVSAHAVDSINLKDPRHGVYEQCGALIARHGVTRGRVRLELAPGERHAGLTVNEYETLLMRHDLADVLSDPLRYAAEKGRHMWANPRAIPARTLDYAKYDMVRTFNEVFDALGLGESIVQRVLSRAIALPAARFLRMKRSVSLLVSDRGSAGRGAIIDGAYQSPILVQWHSATGRSREIMATLSRFS